MLFFSPLSPYLQQNRHPQFIFHNHHLKANPPRPPHSTLVHQRQLLSTSHQLTTVGLLVCLVTRLKTAFLPPRGWLPPHRLPASIGLHTNTQRQIRTALVHMQSVQGTGSRRPNGLICNCKREQHGLLVALRRDASSLGFP